MVSDELPPLLPRECRFAAQAYLGARRRLTWWAAIAVALLVGYLISALLDGTFGLAASLLIAALVPAGTCVGIHSSRMGTAGMWLRSLHRAAALPPIADGQLTAYARYLVDGTGPFAGTNAPTTARPE
uniref:hypothetical protein n=1 Tax=Pseudonocardia sp. CA-138482 TaxID=3240023 RepID=UPI003F497C8A